jgi:photosystem II stability/assembly factor-like uncharacterized protein
MALVRRTSSLRQARREERAEGCRVQEPRLARRIVRSVLVCLLAACGALTAVGTVGTVAATASGSTPKGAPEWGQGSVSCPVQGFCVVVGIAFTSPLATGFIATSHNAGASWVTKRFPVEQPQPGDSVSCLNQRECLVLDFGVLWKTTNGGATWTSLPSPYPYAEIDGLSCPTVSDCTVVGQGTINGTVSGEIWTTSNGGVTWKLLVIPSVPDITRVSCPTINMCMATGYSNTKSFWLRTTDGGKTWQVHRTTGVFNASVVNEVYCINLGYCYVAGPSQIVGTKDGGEHWSAESILGQVNPDSIACSNTSDCVAAGQGIIMTKDAGVKWTPTEPGVRFGEQILIFAVSCTRTPFCMAVGAGVGNGEYRPLVMVTTDGGVTWTKVASPVPSTGP